MSSGQDFIELKALREQLNTSLKLLRKNGSILAKAERDYKVALNKKALELRASEDMPVTLINQVIYGFEDIARLRFDRDVAQTTYNANAEAINVYKLQLRIVENQIGREWTNE